MMLPGVARLGLVHSGSLLENRERTLRKIALLCLPLALRFRLPHGKPCHRSTLGEIPKFKLIRHRLFQELDAGRCRGARRGEHLLKGQAVGTTASTSSKCLARRAECGACLTSDV